MGKKILALLLSLMIAVTMTPAMVFANTDTTSTEGVEVTGEQTTETPDSTENEEPVDKSVTKSDSDLGEKTSTRGTQAAVAQIGQTTYDSIANAVAAADAGDVITIGVAGDYTLPTNMPKNVTIKGGVDGVEFTHTTGSSIAAIPNGATFENVTFNLGNSNYHGFYHAGTIDMNGCTLKGKLFSYGDMNFTNCTFIQTENDYCMWTYVGNVTYKGCNFDVAGKALHVYNEGGDVANVSVDGCNFKSSVANKAAINVKERSGSTPLKFNVEVKNSTTEGEFPEAKTEGGLQVISPLIQVDDKLAEPIDGGTAISVTLDEEVVYTTPEKEYAAAIGETKYETLAEAIGAATNGSVVKLLSDITLTDKIVINTAKEFTLNLNGKVITANTKSSRAFWITASGVKMTIDGTASGSGMAIGDTHAAAPADKVWGFVDIRDNANDVTLTVNGGNYTGSTCANNNWNYGSFFITRTNNAKVILNNLNAETDVCVVNWLGSNGQLDVNDGSYNITGIDAYLEAAFFTGDASATFDDVEITSKYGGCVYTAKNAELTNCDIKVTEDRTGPGTHQNCAVAVSHGGTVVVNSGTYSAPYAVYCYNSGGNVEINNGTFEGTKAAVKSDTSTTEYSSNVTIKDGDFTGSLNLTETNSTNAVSGGTFSEEVPDQYCAEGFKPEKTADGRYGVIEYFAQIGDAKYETLVEAVKAAKSGDTIKLIKDAEGDGIFVGPNSKDFTIDLDGHKYTVTGKAVGSSEEYYTQGLHLEKDNNITINNGTITCTEDSGVKMLVQNYSNLTLQGVVLDGTKLPGENRYVLSNNNGNVTVRSTTINAKDGDYAVDVCGFQSYPGVNLVIEDGSVLNGKVEVSSNKNEHALSLSIGSGVTVNGALEVAEGGETVEVTKAEGVEIPAPADYKWNKDGKLVAKVYVAKNGDKKYESLAEAMNEAASGDTIVLLKNSAGNGIVNKSGRNITIDFAGYTYTIDGQMVGSTGTETNGFQLLKDSTVVFKNGTLISTKASILIQNYSNLTLDGMTLDGRELEGYGYALSNNNGEIKIKDTEIFSRATGFAFDVCRYASYPSVSVTVEGDSKIHGRIELYADDNDPKEGFSLTLKGGDFTDATIKVSAGGNLAEVTKAEGVQFAAPKDYKWNSDGELVPKDYVVKNGSAKYESLEEATEAAKNGDTIQLIKNIDLTKTFIVPADKEIVLDLNGKTVTNDGTVIINKGKLTVKDTGENGTIKSNKNIGVGAGSNSVTTVKSGKIVGTEGAIITGNSTGAVINIDGGTFEAIDNAVLAGNGTNRDGEVNTFNVSGGTFIGKIQSPGYIACGIYSPWKDEFNVSGGTFNITNGAGIVARAGNVKVTGGTFNVTGSAEGWVGDNKNAVPCAAIVFDSKANYPAMTEESDVDVSGGEFNAEVDAIAVIPSTDEAAKRVAVVGGTFSSDITPFCSKYYAATRGDDGKYSVLFDKSAVIDKINKQEETIEKLNDTISSQADSISKQSATIAQQAQAITDAINKIEELKGIVNEQNADIDAKAQEIATQNKAINDKLAEIEEQTAKITQLSTEIQALKTAIESQDGTIESQNELIGELTSKITALDGVIKSQGDTIGKLKTDVETLSGTITGLNAKVDQLETNLNKAVEDQTAALNEEIGKLKAEITALKDNTSSLGDKITALETKIGNLTAEITTLNGKIEGQAAQITELKETINSQNEEIKDLKDQVESQTTAVDALEKVIEEQTAQIEEQGQKIDDQTAKIDEQSQKIDDQATKIEEQSQKINELNGTIETLTDTLAAVRKSLAEMNANSVSLNPTVKTTYNSAVVSWTRNSNATGYEVSVNGGDFKKVVGATSYKAEDLDTGKTYKFAVRAYVEYDNTVANGADYTVSAKPSLKKVSTPTAKNIKTRKIKTTWSAVDGASYYQVSMSTSKSSKKIVNSKTTKRSYTKSKLKKGKTYYVSVRAVRIVDDKKVYGSWSNLKSCKVKK